MLAIYFNIATYADITIYLLHTTSFLTLKNYKALQSYKYFTAGWVLEHMWKCFTDCYLIIGKVNHHLHYNLGYHKKTGTVVCGHCTYMAELGQTCSCVGALLYWIEYKVRRYADISSTSKSNAWLEPCVVRHAPYLCFEDIDITTVNQNIKTYVYVCHPSSLMYNKPNQDDCNTKVLIKPLAIEDKPYYKSFV